MITRKQLVSVEIEKGQRTLDISIPAIESAMRIKGIQDQWDVLNRVRRLFFSIRENRSEDKDEGG